MRGGEVFGVSAFCLHCVVLSSETVCPPSELYIDSNTDNTENRGYQRKFIEEVQEKFNMHGYI